VKEEIIAELLRSFASLVSRSLSKLITTETVRDNHCGLTINVLKLSFWFTQRVKLFLDTS